MAFAALTTGVSGVAGFTEGVSIVSDNIANVNSTGFKRSEGRFSSLITDSPQSTKFNPGGVRVTTQRFVDQQGLLEATQRSTDLGINGRGFFVVRDDVQTGADDGVQFTRAGDFQANVDGDLVNSANKVLLGVPLDADGNPTASPTNVNNLVPVNTRAIAGTADPSTTSGLGGNLPSNPTGGTVTAAAGDLASGATTPQETTTVSLFTGQGSQVLVDVAFAQTAANTYRVEAFAQDPSLLQATGATDPHGADGILFSGTATFNADGTLASFAQDLRADGGGTGPVDPPAADDATAAGDDATIDVPLFFSSAAAGVSDQSVQFDLGTVGSPNGLNQNDGLFSVQDDTDGAVFGEVIGTTVREDGTVSANFDNGISRDIFQVPLATFNNPNDLTPGNGGVFTQNVESGNPGFSLPGTNGSGTLAPGSLEQSTVDLAAEFSDLIVNQRGFSANARVISTSDEILQELTSII